MGVTRYSILTGIKILNFHVQNPELRSQNKSFFNLVDDDLSLHRTFPDSDMNI